MRSFKISNRKQLLLLTHVSLDSIAPLGSTLRCIYEMVDQLDTTEIQNNYYLESEQALELCHPKTLIKRPLYSLYNCQFTMRKMTRRTAWATSGLPAMPWTRICLSWNQTTFPEANNQIDAKSAIVASGRFCRTVALETAADA